MKGMKIIGLEEHYRTHAIEKATEKLIPLVTVSLLSCPDRGLPSLRFGDRSFEANGCDGHRCLGPFLSNTSHAAPVSSRGGAAGKRCQ